MTCPLENTKHFNACALTGQASTCSYQSECASMLEDEKRVDELKKTEETIQVVSNLINR